MPRGFFAQSEMLVSRAPASLVPKCGACGLCKRVESPKMAPSGHGKRKILIVGEAPGGEEDAKGIQFVGKTGRYLEKVLKGHGIDMRRDCYLTNAVICRPPDNKLSKKEEEVDFCRPNLIKTVKELKPHLIIPVGGAAIRSLMEHVWSSNEAIGKVSKWVGHAFPSQKLNAWICPTFHPTFVLRQRDNNQPVAELVFDKHIAGALDHVGRPWSTVPNFEAQVERVLKTSEAARVLREMARRGGWVAFDYETNMLKPDWPEARIISAAVCWRGKKTIAYPWHGEAIEATQELLAAKNVYKIASNLKFEDRWTRRMFGHGVRNWLWDTMVNGHVYDNRPGITGLGFQSLLWLGQDSYYDHISPLMKAEKGKRTNRVAEEIEINDLLRYNGLDAILEYFVCIKQREAFGYEPYKAGAEI